MPISSIDDMEILLDGLPLGEVTTSMTINATAAILLAFYVAVADERGIPRDKLGGTRPERHPQGVHRARHVHLPDRRLDAPGDRHLRVLRARAAALEHDLDQRLPHARGRRDRGPGARLHARRRHRLRRGGARRAAWTSTPSPAGCRSSSPPGASSSRRSPSSAPRAACGRASCATASAREEPRSMMCRFHVQTAGSSLTAQSVDNNVVRTTIQALAAVLGGDPEPAHQRPRRGAGAADRGGRPPRPAHPADHRLRGRRDRDARPARPAATSSRR